MLNLNISKIPKSFYSSKKDEVTKLLEQFQKHDQGFYTNIDDPSPIKKIKTLASQAKGKFSHIVVCGIGGSALGTICLQKSLKHLFKNELKTSPKLYVLDNIDPELITQVQDVIDIKKTLFIIITKSGSTPETLSQYFYFRVLCDKHKLNPKNHFIFITGSKGQIRDIANKEEIAALDIPENIGGRFSVLTPVGLLPAALIGINIDKLIKGAQEMRKNFLSTNPTKNLSFLLALIQHGLLKKGINQTVMMPYSQRLLYFADWYRQLLAESIGKKKNNKGKVVNTGITPIKALGVTDQHSQSQLYNEGPNDKLFIFLETKKVKNDPKIPSPEFKNITFKKLLDIEKKATTDSLTKNNRPNLTITIDSVNEESLGQLFMLFMGSIAFLGELLDINAFDQPGVELSKILTKKALSKL